MLRLPCSPRKWHKFFFRPPFLRALLLCCSLLSISAFLISRSKDRLTHTQSHSTSESKIHSTKEFKAFLRQSNTSEQIWNFIRNLANQEYFSRQCFPSFSPLYSPILLLALIHLDYLEYPNIPETQIRATFQLLEHYLYGNTHSLNPAARHSDNLIDALRETILSWVGGDSLIDAVIFTNGKDQAIKTIVFLALFI